MNIDQFERPTEHPWGMLEGYGLTHTMESEARLVLILIECIRADRFMPIESKYTYPQLVKADLLEGSLGKQLPYAYSLTKKAKGLLYAYYGKE